MGRKIGNLVGALRSDLSATCARFAKRQAKAAKSDRPKSAKVKPTPKR